MQPPETLTVETQKLYCDGEGRAKEGSPGEGAGGHPRVFLTMGKEGFVDCPYCGRHYVLAKGARTGTGH